MDTKFNLEVSIELEPAYSQAPPEISVTVANCCIFDGSLTEARIFSYSVDLVPDEYKISVSFYNKTNKDTNLESKIDKAVIIKSITLNKISDPKFIWEGVYTPIYPEPWATEQKLLGNKLPTTIKNSTYLGWNGCWTLTVDIPIFTWIHRLKNLGWIYS